MVTQFYLNEMKFSIPIQPAAVAALRVNTREIL